MGIIGGELSQRRPRVDGQPVLRKSTSGRDHVQVGEVGGEGKALIKSGSRDSASWERVSAGSAEASGRMTKSPSGRMTKSASGRMTKSGSGGLGKFVGADGAVGGRGVG